MTMATEGMNLPPYRSRIGQPCRKCGTAELFVDVDGKKKTRGPTDTYEPARESSWLARLFGVKSYPERMRRECQFCKAVYYELTTDRSTSVALVAHADSMLKQAMKDKAK